MRFGQDFIEKVQETNNLVDIISQYTQLKPAAGGFMGRCPFPDHPEKTASFSVSEAKQVYNCFGCGKRGNIFTFLRDYNGMSFRDALEYLAERARIPIPEVAGEDSGAQDLVSKKKKELMAANKIAAQFFVDQLKRLPPGHFVREYLNKRGLTTETVETFQIGYAPEEWDSLVHHLKAKGISMSLAEEARLVKARKEGNGHFDLFRDRLMFPILNSMGDPIAFGGRILLQGEPKYLNSPETPVFIKGKVLYGLSQTAKFIRAEDQVLLVEGYMDLVALYQSGIPQVVATMGTALTADHGKSLGRMTKNVIALFDGDAAGQAAAEKSLPLLLAAELHPKGLILPDEMDPDDFVKAKGPELLKSMLDRAPDLFSLVLSQWTKDFRGEATQKVELCDRLLPLFEAMRDQRLKGLYFREVQAQLGVDEAWLREALHLAPKQQKPAHWPATPVPGAFREKSTTPHVAVESSNLTAPEAEIEGLVRLAGAPQIEVHLFGLMLKNRAYWDEALSGDVASDLTHPGLRLLLEKAMELTRQPHDKFDKLTGLLTSIVDRPELLIGTGDDPAMRNPDEDEWENQSKERGIFRDYLRKVKDLRLKGEADQIQRELKVMASPEKMERLMKIQRERMALRESI